MKTIAISILLTGLVAGSPALAQTLPGSVPDLAAHAPVIQQSAGVEYISGGASLEQREAIAAVQSRFPLRIVLSGKGGEYVVAETLTVRDSNGKVITVRDAGPLVMMSLPPGKYTVEASYLGKTHTATVQLGTEARTLNWSWPGA